MYKFTFEETLNHEKGRIFPSDMSERTLKNLAHHDNVIDALEKQIPVKPLNISSVDENDNADVECICHSNNNTAVKRIKKIYCWHCGQCLSWQGVGGMKCPYCSLPLVETQSAYTGKFFAYCKKCNYKLKGGKRHEGDYKTNYRSDKEV